MSMLGLDPLEVVNTPPLKQTPSYSNVNTGMLEKERLSGGGFSVGQDFVNRDLAAREQGAEQTAFTFGIGEDVAGYDKDYLSGDFADRINMSGQN